MAADTKKRKIFDKNEFEMSDEDKKLQEDLLQLVDDITEGKSLPEALAELRRHMRTSTTSMTAVPKPLKYLRDSYEPLKCVWSKMPEDAQAEPALDGGPGCNKRRLADIISVLAMAGAPEGSRECLEFCLRGGASAPGDWGHEYVRRLEMEIVAEWSTMPLVHEAKITKQLTPLVKRILKFDMQHHAEIQACDLCLEINQLSLLESYLDKNNYPKVCTYLVSSADYTEDLERREILKSVTGYYLKFNEHSKAMLVGMQLGDDDLVLQCFSKCRDPLMRKQLAYILARFKDRPLREACASDDAAEIEAITSNAHVNGCFGVLARELDILEPKTPDEIYKTWLETGAPVRMLEHDSARLNLAASFASGFVHAGFGCDKLMANTEQCWVYRNKEHAMLSATASLGLIHMWDVDGGLVPIDKFLYASDDLVKSGALLAIGLVNCGVRNECDPAMALLSEHVMAPSQNLRIGAILGLGIAYAASRRSDLNHLLAGPLLDKASTMEVVALAALSLGLVNVGSSDAETSSVILQKLIELTPQELSSTYTRFLPLALGMVYMGSRDNIEAVTAALDVLPSPYRLPAQTMVQVCSYAGSGDVLVVQELLRICSEPVENENSTKKSSSSTHRLNSGKDHKSKKEDVPSEIALTQPIASLGVAVVGLSEGKENSRIFGQIGRYGSVPARTAVPLAFGLSYLSSPEPALLDVLNKYSHDSEPEVALNAIFALGLLGAGTNNSRVATMLRQLAAYHSRNPSHLFLIRISQGLVHLGKIRAKVVSEEKMSLDRSKLEVFEILDFTELQKYFEASIKFIQYLDGAVEGKNGDNSTCNEIIGKIVYAKMADNPKGDGSRVLNFQIKLDDFIIIPFAIWESDIARLQPKIIMHDIIHIDAFHVKPVTPDSWSFYHPFKLSCISHTHITTIKKPNESSFAILAHETLKVYDDIEACLFYQDNNDLVGLELFVFDEFVQMKMNSKVMTGVFFDKKLLKIPIDMLTYHEKFDTLVTGQKVKLYGKLKINKDNTPCLEVNGEQDVQVFEEKYEKSIPSYVVTPKKIRESNEENAIASKRQKENA